MFWAFGACVKNDAPSFHVVSFHILLIYPDSVNSFIPYHFMIISMK